MQPILSRYFLPAMIHLPPAHLADTQAKLGLNFNGPMGEDTANPRLVFTCTQKPCVGASFDVPEDATAEQLEEAYIAKRDQFVLNKSDFTDAEIGLLRSVFTQRLETYREFSEKPPMASDGPDWERKAALAQSILNKLAK